MKAALIAAVLAAPAAFASARFEHREGLTLEGGWDDDVLLTGAGGDEVGRVAPMVQLALQDEHLDATAGYAGDLFLFRQRDAAATAQALALGGRFRATPRLTLSWAARGRYANDPLALARWGLLRPSGDALLGDAEASLAWQADVRTTLTAGYRQDRLFFGLADPSSGAVHAPYAAARYRLTPRDAIGLRVRAQAFTAMNDPGVLGTSGGAFAEYARRLTPHLDLELSAGPMAYGDRDHAPALVPRAFATLEYAEREDRGLHVAAGRDLVVGAGHAGALVGDLAEVGGFWEPTLRLRLEGRFGFYRDGLVPFGVQGVAGYVADASADVAIGGGLFLGAGASRLAGIGAEAGGLSRDVVTARLGWRSHGTLQGE